MMAVVLVVEDNPALAVAVAEMVQCSGFEATVARSGPEALTFILGRHPVDFVVLDERMPGMSGLDVLRALRSDSGAYPNPPPVAMFSADETAREEAIRLGAVGFVCKPDCGTLLPLIERHVSRAGAARTSRSRALGEQLEGPGAPDRTVS